MLKHLWWEDVKNDVKDIKLFMFAMASNPAWWIAFIETIRQQKEDELRNHKKSKRVIKFTCYCPFNKRFSKWYEFTKTDWVYSEYMKPCEKGRKDGFFGGSFDLKQHCNNVDHWSHWMLKVFTSELFEVCPNEYTQDINPDMIAALEDGAVQVSNSVANNEIFKAYARHNRVNSYVRQTRVNSCKGNYRNQSYVRNHQW